MTSGPAVRGAGGLRRPAGGRAEGRLGPKSLDGAAGGPGCIHVHSRHVHRSELPRDRSLLIALNRRASRAEWGRVATPRIFMGGETVCEARG